MNKSVFFVNTIICIFVFSIMCTAQSQTSNSISGFVLDSKNKTPVPDVYVELFNDNYSSLGRQKTDGSGRFFFAGISSGNFKVRVLPYGTNYLEETQDAVIVNNRIGTAVTSDAVYLDFYLRPDPRKINVDSNGTVGAIFVQEIPPDAEKLFKTALANFGKENEVELGFENIKKALAIFPDYYDALNRISMEYVRRSKYYESLPYVIKAVNINKRSYSCHYFLGLAAFNLKQYKESAAAFKLATVLNPDSVNAQIQYGMLSRITGSFKESETALLKAISLSKESINAPNNSTAADAFWQLALLYEKLERYDESANQLEKYLKHQTENVNKQQIQNTIASLRKKALEKKSK